MGVLSNRLVEQNRTEDMLLLVQKRGDLRVHGCILCDRYHDGIYMNEVDVELSRFMNIIACKRSCPGMSCLVYRAKS